VAASTGEIFWTDEKDELLVLFGNWINATTFANSSYKRMDPPPPAAVTTAYTIFVSLRLHNCGSASFISAK
jgi:hypothetical protein